MSFYFAAKDIFVYLQQNKTHFYEHMMLSTKNCWQILVIQYLLDFLCVNTHCSH